jgi:segregation and condensation protein A
LSGVEPHLTSDTPAEGAGGARGQTEMPFAIVYGKAITEIPKDLYIPPDALEVILEAFEGPLDLLLYLIRRQNIDILEIDVSEITVQYVAYVEMMGAMHFELAAEYLVMAAMLAEIKSRMLLPRSASEEDQEEEDPRAALIRRLQEYERFKQAAEDVDALPRQNRDFYVAKAQAPDRNLTRPDPDVDLRELLVALAEVLRRADMFVSHHVEKERLSTRERMGQVLDKLRGRQFVPFVSLFTVSEGRLGVVVTFLAVLELIKESLVEIVQSEEFGPIHVKARAVMAEETGDMAEISDGEEPALEPVLPDQDLEVKEDP